MLLIHMTPFNKDLVPWSLDYAEINNEGYFQTKRIVIRPPHGICPSPKYAIAFDEDCTVLFKTSALGYSKAASAITKLLSTKNKIVFSNSRSIVLFKKLLATLLLPDLLTDKKVTCFKSLLQAAIMFKGMFATNTINNNRELAISINPSLKNNTDGIPYITVFHTVFNEILSKEPKLVSYFLDKKFAVNQDYNQTHKIFVALNDERIFIFSPFQVREHAIYAFDLVKDCQPIVLPTDGCLIFTIASVISKNILELLNTSTDAIYANLSKVSGLFEDSNQLDNIVKTAEENHIAEPTDVHAIPDYNKYNQLLKNKDYLRIIALRDNVATLIRELGNTKNDLFNITLDYLYNENSDLLPFSYEETYRELIEKRIKNNRDSFVNEFEEIGSRAIGNKKVIDRLENLYKFLSA